MSKTPKPKISHPTASLDKVISIRLPRDLIKAVEGNARSTKRSAAQVYREALTIGLQRLNAPPRAAPKPIPGRISNAELKALSEDILNMKIGSGKTLKQLKNRSGN